MIKGEDILDILHLLRFSASSFSNYDLNSFDNTLDNFNLEENMKDSIFTSPSSII